MWGYAPAAPGGVKLPYHQATAQDRCVDDVASPSYNQIVRESAAPSWKSAEHMKMPTDHYKYLVVLRIQPAKSATGRRKLHLVCTSHRRRRVERQAVRR